MVVLHFIAYFAHTERERSVIVLYVNERVCFRAFGKYPLAYIGQTTVQLQMASTIFDLTICSDLSANLANS